MITSPKVTTVLKLITFTVVMCGSIYLAVQYNALRDALRCDVTVKSKITSPYGDVSAFVFERGCGATAPENTQVAISDSTSQSADKLTAFLVIRGRHNLSVRWLKSNELEVVVPRGEKIYRKTDSEKGITIVYK